MFCTKCGKKIEDNAFFCTGCGARVASMIPEDGGKTVSMINNAAEERTVSLSSFADGAETKTMKMSPSQDTIMTPPAMLLRSGAVLNGRYTVEKVCESNNFGITYAGVDGLLNKKVLIKEFFPNSLVTRNNAVSANVQCIVNEADFQDEKRKVLKEARMLAKLANTPGVVTVRNYFEENNTAYIVTEYIEGDTLRDAVRKNGVMTPDRAYSVMLPVIDAAGKLHGESIIHRDICPENIVLCGNTSKLLDFGAARDISVNTDSGLSVILKHGYAPQEQYSRKGSQGPWTDVYSICATLYYCMTGKAPDSAFDRIQNDDLTKPSELGIKISPSQEDALMSGLALFPKDRIQSIDEFTSVWNKDAAKAAAEAAEEAERKRAEDEARKAAEEKAKREAEEAAQRRAEYEARKAAEEAERKKAEEAARLAAVAAAEAARKEAEEKAKREAEEAERKRAEDEARKAAEEKAQREAEEAAKRRAEYEARKAAEEAERKKAEEAARLAAVAAAEAARKEAEEKAKREAEEAAKRRAEYEARKAAEEAARKEAIAAMEAARNRTGYEAPPAVAAPENSFAEDGKDELTSKPPKNKGAAGLTVALIAGAVIIGLVLFFAIRHFLLSSSSNNDPADTTAAHETEPPATKDPTVAVNSVSLNRTTFTLVVGDISYLSANVSPSDASNREVVWGSSDSSVVTVLADGTIIAQSEGVAEITAATVDGNKTASCTVTVITEKVSATGISLNQSDVTLNVGETFALKATVYPNDATNKDVTWQSGNTLIADVDDNGVITAKGAGNVTITATAKDGGFTAYCHVTSIFIPVKSVSLNESSLVVLTGDTYKLEATVHPANASDPSIRWESSNPSVATVDSSGTVTARSAGVAKITAITSDEDIGAICIFQVYASDGDGDWLVHASLDQVTVNGSDVASHGNNPFQTAVVLNGKNIGNYISLRGWVGTTSEIKGFGYYIVYDDYYEKKTSAEWTVEPGQDVIASSAGFGANYAKRFEIMVPIREEYGNEYTIRAEITTDAGSEIFWIVNVRS